jgi:LPS export ABC transporter permease LptG/LPS export ABC transporter permease LptF
MDCAAPWTHTRDRHDRPRARVIVAADVKILDRYLVREILPPFLLALGLFTFLMAVKPMLEYAQDLLVKGVPLPTIGFLLLTLLPQSLGITIPMALLTGVLMGLGRLSADREAVAMLACGVSPLRLLRPVLVLALLAGGANMYLLIKLVPDANQRFREETFRLLAQQGENDIRPGVFYEGFPGKVLHVRALRPGGGWLDVMLADTSQPGRPAITLAPEGGLEVNEERREVAIVLPGESQRYVPGKEPGVYDTSTARDLRFAVSAESVFGTGDIMVSRGLAEMSIADLKRLEAEKVAAGISPHREVIYRHQMFSFPVACLVFAIIGVALGIHTRKEGKLGGLTLGIGVIALYYAVMAISESLTKGGQFPPEYARWMPNLIIGLIAVAALRARIRNTGREWTIAFPNWVTRRRRASNVPSAARSSAATGEADRVVVVIRIPDIELPRVRLLDRYVSRRYLNVAMLSFFGLILLYYIGTLIDKSERLFKGQATTAMLFEYFYHSTPQFIVHVAPMATLVAVLATIGGLTRTGELTVMRACGVSLYRVGFPLILLALVWSGGLFLLDDRVLAHANRRAEALEDQLRGNPSHTTNTIANANWLAGRDGRVYYYSTFDLPRQTLYGLSIFEPLAGRGRLTGHTMVTRATFARDAWTGTSGWIQSFPEPTRSVRTDFETRILDLPSPEDFSGMHNQAVDLMTYGDLRQYVANQVAGGFSVVDTRVELARRLAFPFVTLVMTVLGIPFGVSLGKRGALYGVGLALVLGAGYWLVDTFFVAIGQAGLLTPVFAAWAANLLFLALALYAVFTVRT